MVEATVKTVQFIDPRIEPQPDPVYDYVIGPTQNQYYKIPASGRSNSSITFNNLTTLGADRAYLDTFEIEISATFTFHRDNWVAPNPAAGGEVEFMPKPGEWVFDSFPFNKSCDEVRININGGAFFSQPLSYVRAKERYMDQWELSKCYENVCPYNKPILQTESGHEYDTALKPGFALDVANMAAAQTDARTVTEAFLGACYDADAGNIAMPTRLGIGVQTVNQSAQGMDGGFNNSFFRLGTRITNNANKYGWENYYVDLTNGDTVIHATWREPIFCSPFSSRYDATYGRPLYNITSMDLSFSMPTLQNMIRYVNLSDTPVQYATTGSPTVAINYAPKYVYDFDVNIDSAQLCYQVMTIPSILTKPLTTLVPYRRFVPYITDQSQRLSADTDYTLIGAGGRKNLKFTSGVYTFNEIPTAIWIFVAPNRAHYQQNGVFENYTGATGFKPSKTTSSSALAELRAVNTLPAWDSNKVFAYIKHVNLSMANTTQILNRAEQHDLYRIAKANGCQDSWWSWASNEVCLPRCPFRKETNSTTYSSRGDPQTMFQGVGSVLRLKPGVDLIVPDQPLIPGANAYNMVFQAEVDVDIPKHSGDLGYSLWLLFEYVGVAAISPGQCEITMNPLGTGEVMAVSPVMSATSDVTEGRIEGSGFWDKTKKGASIAAHIADEGIISRILKHIPGAQKAAAWAASHGLGEPGCKRARGGAVIGHGMKEWM